MRNISRPAVAYGGKAPGRALVINASSITIVELQAGLLQAGIVLVGVAYSFDEALRMIDDFAPDILFIDILLAGRAGSGISFLSEVTASGFPIVYVAGAMGKDAISRLTAIGPCGFISWPYDAREIVGAAQLAVEKARYERRGGTASTDEHRNTMESDPDPFTSASVREEPN
jgi:DNA-binding NarL/FixJ family response regulator